MADPQRAYSDRGITNATVQRSKSSGATVTDDFTKQQEKRTLAHSLRADNSNRAPGNPANQNYSPYRDQESFSNPQVEKHDNPRYQTVGERRAEENPSGSDNYRSINNAKVEKKKDQEKNASDTQGRFFPPQTTPRMKAHAAATKTKNIIERVVAATIKLRRVLIIVVPIVSFLWLFQLLIAAMGIAGIGAELAAIEAFDWIPGLGEWVASAAGALVPGYSLFMISWGLNAIIGNMFFLLGTIILLFIFKIPWTEGRWGMIGLCMAIIGYSAPIPIFQAVPWVYIFLFTVWLSAVSEPTK